MELRTEIPVGDELTLEGRYARGDRPDVAVVAHPHPLYGGSMDNNVVEAVCGAAGALGCATLRFNFRGVGRSGGRHDEGDGEVDDIIAATGTARARTSEDARVILIGYSFGAWVAARAVDRGLRPHALCLVSPPVDFVSFAGLTLPDLPALVVVGGRDDYCSLGSLTAWLEPQDHPPKQEIIEGASHFYFGAERPLVRILGGFLGDMLG